MKYRKARILADETRLERLNSPYNGTHTMPFSVSRRRFAPYFVTLLAGALVFPTAGCSPSEKKSFTGKANLTGVVIVQGQPLKAGIIKVVCEDNETRSADVKNGKFTVADVPPGKVSVSVEPAASAGGDKTKLSGLKAKEYTVTAEQMRIEVTYP